MIEFDISWENSWRTSTFESNWDAAWVFVKFSPRGQNDWHHAALHYVDGFNDGHIAPAGATIHTMANSYANQTEGVGVMIYRNNDGIGDIGWQQVQLRWDYGVDGIADDQVVEISAFAIEMVYVPQGAFYVGDGDSGQGNFEAGNTGQAFLISSENSITLGGTNPSHLSNHDNRNGSGNDDFDYSTSTILPAAFPKGFDAFYCMKYEASQQQYANFLSHLSGDQRTQRNAKGTINFGIEDGLNYAIAEYPWRAMGNMDWKDIAAYLDWSGLRPMTELEYEKACRGPLDPIPFEYAWGSNGVINAGDFPLENEGSPNEIFSTNLGLSVGYCNYGTPLMRCGIFAASALNKTRLETSASYWGIMELSGNAYEFTLSLNHWTSRNSQGYHGDGEISSNGEASGQMYTDWASALSIGAGWRQAIVSNRYFSGSNDTDRHVKYGIRGVRTAQ
ncbi:MAG: SUMF1/EgtB/PvdO family nonheme iron enzyme [Bacteroidota bacterium]